MLNKKVLEAMGELYTLGSRKAGYDVMFYYIGSFELELIRCADNGSIVATFRGVTRGHIATYVFRSMTDFRNHLS